MNRLLSQLARPLDMLIACAALPAATTVSAAVLYFDAWSKGRLMKTTIALTLLALGCVCASSTYAATIEFVTVGNPGNAPDTRYHLWSVGSVAKVYQIGKYEVTAGQYTEFLNAVAKADPNELYNPAMGDPVIYRGANIQRTGSSPNYSYSVAADWANRPVNYVSFFDAARFANWLHNGQPTGPQGPATTEGGAYHDPGNAFTAGRNPGARFFIPTQDEWYKAAYHDKSAALAASYFDYPTGTNSPPGNGVTETTNPGNNANFNLAIGDPYDRTEVGDFELSASPYGTFDQGGNVGEWNETRDGPLRGVRGGAFRDSDEELTANAFSFIRAENELNATVGFRVASPVPEPSTLLLTAFVITGLAAQRRTSCQGDEEARGL